MKCATFAALLALGAALPALAELETYSIDPSHTFPQYEVGHFDYSFQRGRFNRTAGKIQLDTAAKSGSAFVTIDVASVSTGVPKLDEVLQSPDFFDGAKYPQITFRSADLVFEGERVTAARGELTMHGITRPVTLQVTYFRCAPHPMLNNRKVCGADLTATIKRSEFGMRKFLPALADDVVLRINVEAMKDS